MHHRLDFVAQERFFDEAGFVAFCGTNGERLGVIGTGAEAIVSTMNADRLCAAYAEAGGRHLSLEEWCRRHGYARNRTQEG